MVPGLCPPWYSDILAGTIKIPVAESFRHLKTYSLDYTKCSPGRAIICHFSILRICPKNQLVLLGARYTPTKSLLHSFPKDAVLWLKSEPKLFSRIWGKQEIRGKVTILVK